MQSAAKRSYGDPCGIARALDVIGERWALLLVRELTLGPKRFTDLRAGLPTASPNVLSQRLRELESAGVVRRRSKGAAAYVLTEWGSELHPLLVALGRWGARAPLSARGSLSIDALLLALEATFDGDAAVDLRATVQANVAEDVFTLAIRRGKLRVSRGGSRKPDVIVTTDADTLRALAFGDLAIDDATSLVLEGDRRLAKKFFSLFRRPRPGVIASDPA